MTSYESTSIALAMIALVVSTFSIIAAFAAKRSAAAAEKQANHAEIQALAAMTQASAAEKQTAMQVRTLLLAKIEQYRTEIATIDKVRFTLGIATITAMTINLENPSLASNRDSGADLFKYGESLKAHAEEIEIYATSEADLQERLSARRSIAHHARTLGQTAKAAAFRVLKKAMPDNSEAETTDEVAPAVKLLKGQAERLRFECDTHVKMLQTSICSHWLEIRRIERLVRGD